MVATKTRATRKPTLAELQEAVETRKVITDVSCPACKQENSRVLRLGIFEDPNWPVYLCRHCRLQYIEPLFDDLKEYYRTEYRRHYSDKKGHTTIDEVHVETAEERYNHQYARSQLSAKAFMEQVPEGASVLEIGCSAGGFLGNIQDTKKFELFASEWNAEDAAFVRDVGEIPCEEGDLDDIFPGKTFTAIVARQVLEHQVDPVGFLESCKKRLIGGGWLFLELPCATTAVVAVYNIPEAQNWWFRAPHITYWEPGTLGNLLNALGFEAKIKPIQRTGLEFAFSWLVRRLPTTGLEAILPLQPIRSKHPLAPALNRIWQRFDAEYRIQMETLGCTDQMRIFARRREI